MKTIQSLITLIIFTLLFNACNKHTVPVQQTSTYQGLTGIWKWVRSTGGFANITKTPESARETRSIQFANDNQYFMYVNEAIVSYGTYTLEKRQCIHDHTNKDWINFSAPADRDQMIEKVSGSDIELSDDVYDGFDNFYTKTSN